MIRIKSMHLNLCWFISGRIWFYHLFGMIISVVDLDQISKIIILL